MLLMRFACLGRNVPIIYASEWVRCRRYFFFSSRRRHTRLQGDWSSDVCSSDLISHVGIYVGEGYMIHASSASRRVVEAPVDRYRPPGGLQWKGVRRVIALDSVAVDRKSVV